MSNGIGASVLRKEDLRFITGRGRYTDDIVRYIPGTDAAVERAIASLPDRTRCILVLRDIEAYSPAEITGLLGVSEKTVRQRIREARRLVRYQLGQ